MRTRAGASMRGAHDLVRGVKRSRERRHPGTVFEIADLSCFMGDPSNQSAVSPTDAYTVAASVQDDWHACCTGDAAMAPDDGNELEERPLQARGIDADDVARIVGAAGTALLVLDGSGIALLANPMAETVLGRTYGDIVGRPVDELLMPSADLGERSRRSDRSREQRTLIRPDGKSLLVESTVTHIGCESFAPAEATYVVVFQDVTAFERLRAERDRLMQLAAVSDVLPAVLHELKNPLAAITSAVELVLEELEEGMARDDLQSVLGEIRRMKLTLEGIGSVGRELAASRPAAIDFAITEAFHVLLRTGTSRGISMECHVPAMPLLPFDPSVVRAIIFNLLQNAIHACENGGTSIRLSAGFDRATQEFRIRMSDTGHGMSEEVIRRCTDLFFTTKSRGSGIGLALVSRAVEGAGGTLTIDSAPGRGTDIEIVLPLPRPGDPRSPRGSVH